MEFFDLYDRKYKKFSEMDDEIEAESASRKESEADSVPGADGTHDTNAEPELHLKSKYKLEPEHRKNSVSKPEAESELDPTPATKPESAPESEAKSETVPEPEAEVKSDSIPESRIDSAPEPEDEHEPEPAPKSESKSDSFSESSADSEPAPEPEAKSETVPEPEEESEPKPTPEPASTTRKASRRDGKPSRRDRKASRRDRGESGDSDGNKVGKIIVCIQIVLSVIFLILLHLTSLFDTKIFLAVLATLAVFAVVFGLLQFFKKRFLQILGIVLSIIVSLVLLLGNYYLFRVNQTANAISGADSSTVQMIVVVPIDDPAETLEDAADYVFGYQYTTDTDNMDSMIDSMESEIGNFEKQEYDSVMDVAEAVLDGEIGAGILNSAFVDLIEDEIDDFSDEVKVIYSQTFTYAVLDDETAVSDDSIFNVLISGIDTDGDISKTSRSDVNIILTVNMNTKKILMTTTPRDYYVEIPGISGGELDKLTHSGLYGVEATMDTLEELYGIEIDYYIRVNFTSLVNVVDALGGVTVDSDYAFETTGGAYSFVEGENFLDGEAALAFSRERYAFSDGDNQRGKNQEAVLTGILEELTSPSALRNANELLDTMIGFVQTNMEKEQLMELVGTQLLSQGDWTFERQAATGTGDSQPTYSGGSVKRYVMWPDEDIVAALANRMQLVLEGK